MAERQSFWEDPEFYLNVVLFALVVTVLFRCAHLSTTARLLPLIVSIGALPLIILNIVASMVSPLKAKMSALKGGDFIKVKHDESHERSNEIIYFSDFLKISLWFIGAYLVFFLGGYLPMVVSFSLLFLKFRIGFTWGRAVIMTLVFSLTTWAVFSLILDLEPFGMRYYY